MSGEREHVPPEGKDVLAGLAAGQPGDHLGAGGRLEQCQPVRLGVRNELGDRAVGDLWADLDRAREGDLVARVDQQPQVREHGLYLRPGEESLSTQQLVADAGGRECVLDAFNDLAVAGEHGDVASGDALLDRSPQLEGDPARFVLVGARGVRHHRWASFLRAVGAQRLCATSLVVADQPVRGGQDLRCAAVVLLELDHARAEVLAVEVQDQLNVGLPEGVDRLVVVAYHRQIAMAVAGCDQQAQQSRLDWVGVLVLVDQDRLPLLLVADQQLLVFTQQSHRAAEQVVEVQRVGPP